MAQPPYFRDYCLLARVIFHVHAVIGESGAIRNIPDPLTIRSLMPEGIASTFARRVSTIVRHSFEEFSEYLRLSLLVC
jgi:hypothetical protein